MKIKINFLGFYSGFDPNCNMFTEILSKHFSIEVSSNPDFVIVSPLCKPFEWLKYDCVRILYTGEPLSPDFNSFDYAIGFDDIVFLDSNGVNRNFRLPFCFTVMGGDAATVKQRMHADGLTYEEARDALARKRYFCNFIYGHESAYGEREELFEMISSYKRVESSGTFMNNMPDGEVVPFSEKKYEFLKLCKFTIACESISVPGFCTEKLTQPFMNDSVPIYYGNPDVDMEFNVKAFINMHAYESFEEGLEAVREVDSDDSKYIKMLMEPKVVSDDYIDSMYDRFEAFLLYIFSQPLDKAYRRVRHYLPSRIESYQNDYRRFYRVFDFAHKVKGRIERTIAGL